MEFQNAWIEGRLAAAFEAAASKEHEFPSAAAVELQKLLSGPLQQPLKPAELEEIAKTLITANRSST